jgi:hypothetical protein
MAMTTGRVFGIVRPGDHVQTFTANADAPKAETPSTPTYTTGTDAVQPSSVSKVLAEATQRFLAGEITASDLEKIRDSLKVLG